MAAAATASADAPPYCKIVVVGDGAVGKTSLLQVYAYGKFPEQYVKTVFDNYTAQVDVQGKSVTLDLWDTAGQEEYERIRSLSYSGVNIFLLCFSLVDHQSLKNAETRWLGEATHHSPRAKVILVGTKLDLRDDPAYVANLRAKGAAPVSAEDGRAAAKRCGAAEYMETSSLKDLYVKQTFDAALVAFLFPPKPTKPKKEKWFTKCSVL
eukprot:TRINITY_DN44779_c0_g1_i1.p1 TRINITY_DN44779_c0_g1~~TRINITY_DN44779_c0_g1_i1.p1  ORF type:complete len:209 (+),score=38.59 TRINITY_DN44779_c0_g1_i1:155-781(+)